jgi:GntR family transcriptional regulator/MocR family aminotransferase
LLAEGYVVSRRGSGTFVAKTGPICFFPPAAPKAAAMQHNAPIFRGAASICSATSAPARASGGVYPRRTGRQCLSPPAVQQDPGPYQPPPKPEQLSYSCNGGTPELQQALVDYLRVSRGVHCQADQILITEGIHQAIDLVTRMLCDSGDLAWVEEPSYWGIRHVLAMNDVRASPYRRCQRPVPAGNG